MISAFFDKKKGAFMTTTTSQHCSWAVLNNTDKYIAKAENDIEDNKRLLLAVADSMNNLCEKLCRLEYLLKRKSMEQALYPKGKGERKGNEVKDQIKPYSDRYSGVHPGWHVSSTNAYGKRDVHSFVKEADAVPGRLTG
jgi:hypothetical protein